MDTISKLKIRTKSWIDEISSEKQEYEEFLKFATNFYKYKTQEVLGMYLQNPNITACASKDVWTRVERKVIDETKVIYAFDYTHKYLQYTKLYDIENTSGDGDISKFQWVYNKDLDSKVAEHFERPIEEVIESNISYKYVNYKDYEDFKEVVLKSNLYLINERCGISPNVDLDFDYEILRRYFYEICNNISNISKPILKDIGDIVTKSKLQEKGFNAEVQEVIAERIKEVEKTVEENISKEYTDYRDLENRIFSFDNKQYEVVNVNGSFLDARMVGGIETMPILRTFRTEMVVDILEPGIKQIKIEELKNEKALYNTDNDLFLRSEDILERYQNDFFKLYGFNFHELQAKVTYEKFIENAHFNDFVENEYKYAKLSTDNVDVSIEDVGLNKLVLSYSNEIDELEQEMSFLFLKEEKMLIPIEKLNNKTQNNGIVNSKYIEQNFIIESKNLFNKINEQSLDVEKIIDNESNTIFSNVRTIMYSDIANNFIKTSSDFVDYEMNLYTDKNGKEFVFGYGSMGNGTVVWNFLEEVDGDYKNVAHLNDDGTVKWIDNELPKNAIDEISNKFIVKAEQNQEKTAETNINIFDVKNYKEPFVVIDWSENANFQSSEVLTFTKADLKFKEIEKAFRDKNEAGYDKTSGTVYYLENENDIELSSYVFRYDIGDYDDEHSGIYNHISNYWAYNEKSLELNSSTLYSKEDVESAKKIIRILEPYKDTTFKEKTLISDIEYETNKKPSIEVVKEYEAKFSEGKLSDEDIDEYYKHVEIASVEKEVEEVTVKETIKPLTEKEMLTENINAIKLIKQLGEEDRLATEKEKEILKKYHGFGGLPDVFDREKNKYIEQRKELISLLSEKEYNQAKGSTLNAHYTSKEIITTMYDTLKQMGFDDEKSRILEPSMGSGRFFEHLPNNLKQANLYGVELDSITGKIAKAIYPNANIQIKGFEDTRFNDNYFDVVIGNIPFGNYKLYDEQYKNENLLIHDYFIAKSLDKVKNGGIVAVVTSAGTLDKVSTSARELIAEKGALIGAIRLPNTAFKDSANTEVVTDILFFQKGAEQSIDWINTTEIELDGEYFPINNYFINNPQMVVGEFEKISGRFGNKVTVKLDKNKSFIEELKKSTELLPKNIYSSKRSIQNEIDNNILVDLEGYENVKNFSFILHQDELYYKYNYGIEKSELKGIRKERVINQIEIKNIVREMLDMQMNECTDEELIVQQEKLNKKYDDFVKKYGFVNDKANKTVFRNDADAPLLLSIENFIEDNLYSKSAIFFERTIAPTKLIEYAETPQEAMFVCMNNKGYIDVDYMAEITNSTREYIISSLEDSIFKNPAYEFDNINEKEYEIKSRYLAGNVLKKLEVAKMLVTDNPIYEKNVRALEEIKPKELLAEEIRVSIGMQWIPTEYYKDFICEMIEVNDYAKSNAIINYSVYTGSWSVDNLYASNIYNTKKYGTDRMNAIRIFEETLNLKTVKLYDTIEVDGKKTRVLNADETQLAREKQEIMQDKFSDWIYQDEIRKNHIVSLYNEKFNNTVLEKFDGSHLTFYGMTNKIDLRPHQKNAVQRILTNGNTLLSHEVGSGKTFTIVTANMEQKRLGLVNKPMIVVPNHLVDQWASEFMRLYPNANILAVGSDDMSKQKRLAFTSRIATGNYDAVIISHSSFEKIPVSKEYRENMLSEEIYQIQNALEETEDRYTVKDLSNILKSKEEQLKKLNNEDDKDDILTFEELGVDSLFVDEAHLYKNLFAFTKLSRVAGVNTSNSQRATDMFLKCQLINNEINQSNRGVVFATGTPISNSISELYTMQKYLMLNSLKDNNLHIFDNWVANFGEITTKNELKPSGNEYAPRERLATFKNIPELIMSYKEVADVVTNDMIDIELPKLKNNKVTIESAKPSQDLKQFTQRLVDRAKKISDGGVDPKDDNMLVVTNDGRKAGLDMRLISPAYEDNPNSKLNKCIDNIYSVWDKTTDKKSTQLVFCDLSTPKTNSQDLRPTDFNVYVDIRNKLLEKGVPLEEIAFIHDCKTDIQKDTLFEKVRKGDIRVLLGSTSKCGAGTNIQDKLVALHDLDCPWRPADLEQRFGRIVRQGNENKEVEVFRYVTEESFDAYLWSIVETKAKFISQIMNGDTSIRHFSDESEIVLSYGEISAIASGNPLIKTSMELKQKIKDLHTLEIANIKEQKELKTVIENAPTKIQNLENTIKNISADIETISNNTVGDVIVNGNVFEKPSEQGGALLSLANIKNIDKEIGSIAGLKIYYAGRDSFTQEKKLALVGKYKMEFSISSDGLGSVNRIKNKVYSYVDEQSKVIERLEKVKKDFVMAKNQVGKEWSRKDELRESIKELERVEKILYSVEDKDKEVERKPVESREVER